MAYHTGTVAGCTIQACKGHPGNAEVGFDTVEERGPLRKDQRLMPISHGFFKTFQEHREFGRGGRCLSREEARMTAGLAQTQQGFEACKHTPTRIEERHHL